MDTLKMKSKNKNVSLKKLILIYYYLLILIILKIDLTHLKVNTPVFILISYLSTLYLLLTNLGHCRSTLEFLMLCISLSPRGLPSSPTKI